MNYLEISGHYGTKLKLQINSQELHGKAILKIQSLLLK